MVFQYKSKALLKRIDLAGQMMVKTRGDIEQVSQKFNVSIDRIKDYLPMVNWTKIKPRYVGKTRLELITIFQRMRGPNRQDERDHQTLEDVDLPSRKANRNWLKRAAKADAVIKRRKARLLRKQIKAGIRQPIVSDEEEKRIHREELFEGYEDD